MDVHTKEQRSYNMSRVGSKNTKPELLMFSLLKKSGYKFKKHYPVLGKPDIVFPEYKVAVFIDGEFWHGRKFDTWKSKLSQFWLRKISGNIKRDKKNTELLRRRGWHVLHLWGRGIVHNPKAALLKIDRSIRGANSE